MQLSFKQKVGVLIAIVIALFGGGVASKTVLLGSVSQADGYYATSTYSKLGTPTFGVNQIIRVGSGIVGSVDISGSVAGAMILMDATSTTDISSTTIKVIPASASARNYPLDITFNRGLIIETTANLVPTSTITWK